MPSAIAISVAPDEASGSLGIQVEADGAVVAYSYRGCPAEVAGLPLGSVIVAVNGAAVCGRDDIARAIQRSRDGERVEFELRLDEDDSDGEGPPPLPADDDALPPPLPPSPPSSVASMGGAAHPGSPPGRALGEGGALALALAAAARQPARTGPEWWNPTSRPQAAPRAVAEPRAAARVQAAPRRAAIAPLGRRWTGHSSSSSESDSGSGSESEPGWRASQGGASRAHGGAPRRWQPWTSQLPEPEPEPEPEPRAAERRAQRAPASTSALLRQHIDGVDTCRDRLLGLSERGQELRSELSRLSAGRESEAAVADSPHGGRTHPGHSRHRRRESRRSKSSRQDREERLAPRSADPYRGRPDAGGGDRPEHAGGAKRFTESDSEAEAEAEAEARRPSARSWADRSATALGVGAQPGAAYDDRAPPPSWAERGAFPDMLGEVSRETKR